MAKVQLEDVEVTYLTNACGEDTGYGTIELTEADYAKVAFEEGPGVVLPYIVQIDGVKYVLGNLEAAYKDDFWGDDAGRFQSEEDVRSYCLKVCEHIHTNLTAGMRLLALDEGDPGRLIVRVAVPLDSMANSDATKQVLAHLFGQYAE